MIVLVPPTGGGTEGSKVVGMGMLYAVVSVREAAVTSHPEEDALAEVLTLLIEDYEEKHYPLPHISPHESLKALMEERGLRHKDIWPVLGNKGAATEVITGHRSISKAQAKRLAEFFHVPVDLFI